MVKPDMTHDMRERLTKIISVNAVGGKDGFVLNPQAVADAIIAALPDMVPELEWWEPSRSNNYTHGAYTIFGTYYVGIDGGRHNAWIELFHDSGRIEQWEGPTRGNLEQAKNDASAHYRARIMAAFGIAPAGIAQEGE